MAGASAGLPAGVRLSDHISLGVIARAFPPDQVRRVLSETGRASERERDLPAQVMVYYAIALALYMGSSTREVLRCLLEGLRWLWGAGSVKVAGRSGISQARTRLGEAPLRQLYKQMVRPIAMRATKGAWYRAWRLVSLDGSCLDVADTAGNGASFGYPGASRGESAFPQLRFVALVESGTHGLFGAQMGRYADGETRLAHDVLTALRPGMLCLADRQFFGYALWQAAAATGAALLWRVKHNLRLPRATGLADGSYLTTLYPSDKDRRHGANGTRVRVVEYRLAGIAGAEPLYRLVTTILGPGQAPAPALAALLPQRGGNEPGPGAGARRSLGGALPRAVGNRGRPGRAEDAPAWGAGRAAQQDPGVGPTGVLGPAAGALRRARADARGGAAGRRGSGPTVVPTCRTRGPAQAAAVRGPFPLGPGASCMRWCWTKFWRSAQRAAGVGRCHAGSSAR